MAKRKNNTNQNMAWPTTPFFTIEDLLNLNAHMKPITVRVRFKNDFVDSKQVVEIGQLSGDKGRPKKVFCMTPVTKIILEQAKKMDVQLIDSPERLFNVVAVSTPPVAISAAPKVLAPALVA